MAATYLAYEKKAALAKALDARSKQKAIKTDIVKKSLAIAAGKKLVSKKKVI